jgi:hypothetical protein
MSYWHRDQNGVAKNKFSNNFAQKMITICAGHFEKLVYKEDEKNVEKVCFIFDDDFANEYGEDFKMFFWKGDRLVPEKESPVIHILGTK